MTQLDFDFTPIVRYVDDTLGHDSELPRTGSYIDFVAQLNKLNPFGTLPYPDIAALCLTMYGNRIFAYPHDWSDWALRYKLLHLYCLCASNVALEPYFVKYLDELTVATSTTKRYSAADFAHINVDNIAQELKRITGRKLHLRKLNLTRSCIGGVPLSSIRGYVWVTDIGDVRYIYRHATGGLVYFRKDGSFDFKANRKELAKYVNLSDND